MSEIVPPQMSDDQRRAALMQANKIRRQRADDKDLIKSRQLDARSVLLNPPEHWKGSRIAYLLRSVPGVGRTKIERILHDNGVSPVKTLGGLSDQQRHRLASALDRYYQK